MFGRVVRGAAALLAALAALPALAAPAWTPNADDAVILEVRSGQFKLGDGVRGYMTSSGTCIDFADTLLALDIQIRLDKKSRRATGWSLDERHGVVIDREAGTEQIKNEKRVIATGAVYDTPEGWCVAPTVLTRWLGVGLSVDTGNALLIVASDRALPAVAALQRRARATAIRPAATFDLASLPRARSVQRGVSVPAVDIVASIGGLRDARSGTRGDLQYEAFVAGEIGPIAYNARLASDQAGRPASLRVQLHRTDPEARLLGPLRATTVAAGDVVGLSTPLVAQSSTGRGAMVTNRPIERRDSFDKIDLRGDLPRGWDAELYRDGQLLGFAQDREDGRYAFLDVPLQFGPNRLEVVLYGPQGQVRREVRQVPIGLDSIVPGKTYYWAGINDDGRDLIDLGAGGRFSRGGWRGSLGVERGLDLKTSAAVALHSLTPMTGVRRTFVEGALRRSFGAALAEASLSSNLAGGYAARLSAVGEVARTRYSVETIWASEFQSDRIERGVTGLHRVGLDRLIGSGSTIIPVGIQARWTTRKSGYDVIDVAARISPSLGRVSATGELVLQQERRPSLPALTRVEAGVLANMRVGRIRLRGETRFEIAPQLRLRSAALVGEWTPEGLRQDISWRGELAFDREAHRVRAALGYLRRFDRLSLAASLEGATDKSVGAGVSVAFSLGRGTDGGVRASVEKLASRGSARVLVFRDTNANGRRDDGEKGEANVGITAALGSASRTTDGAGTAMVDGLDPYQPLLIGIDASTLGDPSLQASGPGIVVVPRPGVVADVEIGLVPAGDIDGTLAKSGGGSFEGVDLELVDASGRKVALARSEFDGFFLFERVPYGSYSIRIATAVADALRVDAVLGVRAVVEARRPSVHLGAVAVRERAVVAGK